MKTARKLVSLSLIFGCLALVQLRTGGHLGQIMQLTSLIGVFGLMLVASLHHLGFHATVAGVSESLIGSQLVKASPETVEEFHNSAPTWVMFAASIVSVLGMIHVMSMLNDPSQIGAGVAVAFLAYIYGGLGVLLFGGSRPRGKSSARSMVTPASALVPAMGLGFLFFTIMYAISQADYRTAKQSAKAAQSETHH